MQRFIFTTLSVGLLFLFAGCYENNATDTQTVTKEKKCGTGKCGDAKPVPKKSQCGTGKCGEGK